MIGESILQVDAGERGGKLAQIGGRRTHEASELAEAPVGRSDRSISARQDQGEALRIVAARFDLDVGAFHGTGAAALGPGADRACEIGERQEAFVVGSREPLGRDAADALAARDIHLVAAACAGAGIKDLHVHG